MRFRKLRIAWSVAWGVVAVLLIALWVRSYWQVEWVIGHVPGKCFPWVENKPGTCEIGSMPATRQYLWIRHSQPVNQWWSSVIERTGKPPYPSRAFGTFGFEVLNQSSRLRLPHWFLILLFVAHAAFPWIRWRFSLRTLLIATTLVAVVLGLIVYAVK